MNTNGTTSPIITTPPTEMRDDARDEARDETRNEIHAENHDETPYVSDQTSSQVNERWRRVQAEFVDDPRKSVAEAHELVSELVERIVESFSSERTQLEGQWSKGGDVSTEDLRVCLKRYRSFFSRLLPSVNGKAA